MRSNSGLEIALYNWLNPMLDGTGVTLTIFGHQDNNPRPNQDFLLITIIEQSHQAKHEVRYSWDGIDPIAPIDEDVIYRATVTVNCSIFSDNDVAAKMELFSTNLYRQKSLDLQYLNKIGLVDALIISDLNNDDNKSDMRLIFNYTKVYNGKIETIGTVTVIYEDQSGNTHTHVITDI
jgi:hypothetical protein